jgi:cytochrome c5
VSADQDRKFFDIFMIVLGALVGVSVGVYGLAQLIAGQTQARFVVEDAIYQQQIVDRIRPVGQVAIAGEDNSHLAVRAAPAASAVAAAAAPAAPMTGEEVYNNACAACHAAGIAGAPKSGDADAWAPRIAQGIDTLNDHAINGFQGAGGYMPPKGGRADLSDEAVIKAVQYMVDSNQ